MLKRPRAEEREQRIQWEIVPDAHDAEEQAAGWWAYLEDTLHFPFLTRCRAERASSPLRLNEEVEVMGLAPDEHEVLVEVRWSGRTLAIPLIQPEVLDADAPTRQAVEDWHYWVERGYQWWDAGERHPAWMATGRSRQCGHRSSHPVNPTGCISSFLRRRGVPEIG